MSNIFNPPPRRIPRSMTVSTEERDYRTRLLETVRLLWQYRGIGQSLKTYSAQTASYTLLSSDYLIEYTAGSYTVSLMSATTVPAGQEFEIKNSGTGTITVTADGSETIDGIVSQTLNQYDALKIMSNGTNWIIV